MKNEVEDVVLFVLQNLHQDRKRKTEKLGALYAICVGVFSPPAHVHSSRARCPQEGLTPGEDTPVGEPLSFLWASVSPCIEDGIGLDLSPRELVSEFFPNTQP